MAIAHCIEMCRYHCTDFANLFLFENIVAGEKNCFDLWEVHQHSWREYEHAATFCSEVKLIKPSENRV